MVPIAVLAFRAAPPAFKLLCSKAGSLRTKACHWSPLNAAHGVHGDIAFGMAEFHMRPQGEVLFTFARIATVYYNPCAWSDVILLSSPHAGAF